MDGRDLSKRTLEGGAVYTDDQTMPLPALDEGKYFVIVRTDVRQSIAEPMFDDPDLGLVDLEANNEGASRQDALIDTSVQRLIIEDELFWKYEVPCGTNHWEQKEKAIERYKRYEEMFGPRAQHKL